MGGGEGSAGWRCHVAGIPALFRPAGEGRCHDNIGPGHGRYRYARAARGAAAARRLRAVHTSWNSCAQPTAATCDRPAAAAACRYGAITSALRSPALKLITGMPLARAQSLTPRRNFSPIGSNSARGHDRLAPVLMEEPDHPAGSLQLRDIAVQIDPVQAGNVQPDMPGHHVRGSHHSRPGRQPKTVAFLTLRTRIHGLRMIPQSAPCRQNHRTRRSEAEPRWTTYSKGSIKRSCPVWLGVRST